MLSSQRVAAALGFCVKPLHVGVSLNCKVDSRNVLSVGAASHVVITVLWLSSDLHGYLAVCVLHMDVLLSELFTKLMANLELLRQACGCLMHGHK